jgi:hypothetical protein
MRWATAAAVAGSAALCAVASPAGADTGPAGVRAGNNLTVFHNIDMIGSFGHTPGEKVQVDLFRGGHRIASVRGSAVSTPDGGALEVNHGPAGAPRPGDCFEGATPDIRPADRIVVSNPGGRAGVDEAIVDDIGFNATPTRRLIVDPATGQEAVRVDVIDPDTGEPTGETKLPPNSREEVWIEGTASFVDAAGVRSPMPTAKLDSAAFIDPLDNQLRIDASLVDSPNGPGTFRARYWAPFKFERNRNGHSNAYVLTALEKDGHAMGYGHTAVLPPTSMLVEGFGEQAGPALGCEAAPKVPSSVGAMSLGDARVDELTLANSGPSAPDLVVGGWAAATVNSAQVVLSNGAASRRKAADLSGGTDARGWSAPFTQAELAELGDGMLTAQLLVDDVPVGAAKSIRRNTAAPAPAPVDPTPTATPAPAAGGGSTAAAAVPVPRLAILGATASSGSFAAQPAVTMRASRVSAPSRLAAGIAKRRGVVASFVAPAGAAYAEAALYRVAGTKRTLVGKKAFATTGGRRVVARFTSAAVRRKLEAGRYVVEVRTGPARTKLGPAVTRALRISR